MAFTLLPGLYWVGAIVQNVVTTQPTLRTVAVSSLAVEMPFTAGATPTANAPGAVAWVGFAMTGALPATWPTAILTATATAARVFVKTA